MTAGNHSTASVISLGSASLPLVVELGKNAHTSDPAALREADFILIAVPTPVDEARIPDFRPLIGAGHGIGPYLKPAATEEICVPVLEQTSGLKWQRDFFAGYSPEPINPGDRERMLTNVIKMVSGRTGNQQLGVQDIGRNVVKSSCFIDVKSRFDAAALGLQTCAPGGAERPTFYPTRPSCP
jgi:UDP-N-acetyl-D-mannosaminuronate dehydrogenase